MKKNIYFLYFLVCVFIVIVYVIFVLGQEILVIYRGEIGELIGVGVLDVFICFFFIVDILFVFQFGYFIFSYIFFGELYVFDIENGNFYSVDLNDGLVLYIGFFNIDFGEIQFVNDSIFYVIRYIGMIGVVGIVNVNIGEIEILIMMEIDFVGYGFGLIVRNDSLYYGDVFGIYYMDWENF